MSAATRNMNFRLELEPSIDFRKKVWFLLKFEVAVALNTSKTLPNITFKESLQIHTCLLYLKPSKHTMRSYTIAMNCFILTLMYNSCPCNVDCQLKIPSIVAIILICI